MRRIKYGDFIPDKHNSIDFTDEFMQFLLNKYETTESMQFYTILQSKPASRTLNLKPTVAVPWICVTTINDNNYFEKIKNEITSICALRADEDHINVVNLYSCFTYDDIFYIQWALSKIKKRN